MRSGLTPKITCGIIAILLLPLEGCGHKGPLKLPPPREQLPQTQTASPRLPDSQEPVLPSPQQAK